MVPPALVEAKFEALLGLETVGAIDPLVSRDSARVASTADPLGTAAQSLVSSSGQPTKSPQFGLYLRRGSDEVTLEYGDFLGGFRNSRPYD